MADDATRAISLERLMQRKDAKHKKELDRLHKRIRQLEARNRELEANQRTGQIIHGDYDFR